VQPKIITDEGRGITMRVFDEAVYNAKKNFVLNCLNVKRCIYCHMWKCKRCKHPLHPSGTIYPEVSTGTGDTKPNTEV